MSDRPHGQGVRGANVLVHISPIDATGDETCLDFLTATPPHRSNVLFISYTRTPDNWMQMWLDHTDERPANLGFIQVGGTTRSAATPNASGTTTRPANVIKTVGDPSNLTELGITISEHLSDWENNSHETVVCFDSLTALLQYTDGVQTAFRFLHTLVGRIRTAEARACYTITPDAHDAQTVATLTGLFDDVLE